MSLTALEKGAVTGEPGAWVELASLLYRRAEEIVAVDETLNHRILEKATAGDVISQYELGVLCINGWGRGAGYRRRKYVAQTGG